MQLWRVPSPWDYHKQAAFVVLAASADEALAIARREAVRLDAEDGFYCGPSQCICRQVPCVGGTHWEAALGTPEPVSSGIYADHGNDC